MTKAEFCLKKLFTSWRVKQGSQDLRGQDLERKEMHWCDNSLFHISPTGGCQFLSCMEKKAKEPNINWELRVQKAKQGFVCFKVL